MKTKTNAFIAACAALVATVTLAPGQTTVIQESTAPAATVETTTLNSMGTVTEIKPSMLVVRSETGPVSYRYSKTTTYVDEAGAPVSIEMVKSGLPVTVHYVREGADLVASKVIVRKTVAPAPAVVEKKTTTTTTTTRKKDDDDDDKD